MYHVNAARRKTHVKMRTLPRGERKQQSRHNERDVCMYEITAQVKPEQTSGMDGG